MTREQFTAYVVESQKALRRFLTALCCGDSTLADDIAQETYMKAYLSVDSFRDSSKFQAWVNRIAYNTYISHMRSARKTVGIEHAECIQADEAERACRYQELYAALARLSGKERTAILLFYLEGYQVKEISEITGASHDAVKQHLSRGRYHLKNLLCKTTI